MARLCPGCGKDNSHAAPLRYSWRHWVLKQCAQCSFVYLENPPPLDSFGTEHSWVKSHGKRKRRMRIEYPLSFKASALVRNVRRRFVKRPDKLADRIKLWFPPGQVVDLGCGDGSYIAALPTRFQPIGIEISETLVRRARKKGATVLHMPAIEGLASLPDSSLTGVIMRSFLEHELEPVRLLNEVARTLKEHGCTIIKVPNYACVNRHVMGSRWCGFHFPGHVNYFTPDSLRDMVARAGLRPVSFGWLDHFFLSDSMWMVACRRG